MRSSPLGPSAGQHAYAESNEHASNQRDGQSKQPDFASDQIRRKAPNPEAVRAYLNLHLHRKFGNYFEQKAAAEAAAARGKAEAVPTYRLDPSLPLRPLIDELSARRAIEEGNGTSDQFYHAINRIYLAAKLELSHLGLPMFDAFEKVYKEGNCVSQHGNFTKARIHAQKLFVELKQRQTVRANSQIVAFADATRYLGYGSGFQYRHLPAIGSDIPGNEAIDHRCPIPIYRHQLSAFLQSQKWVPFVHNILEATFRGEYTPELVDQAVLHAPNSISADHSRKLAVVLTHDAEFLGEGPFEDFERQVRQEVEDPHVLCTAMRDIRAGIRKLRACRDGVRNDGVLEMSVLRFLERYANIPQEHTLEQINRMKKTARNIALPAQASESQYFNDSLRLLAQFPEISRDLLSDDPRFEPPARITRLVARTQPDTATNQEAKQAAPKRNQEAPSRTRSEADPPLSSSDSQGQRADREDGTNEIPAVKAPQETAPTLSGPATKRNSRSKRKRVMRPAERQPKSRLSKENTVTPPAENKAAPNSTSTSGAKHRTKSTLLQPLPVIAGISLVGFTGIAGVIFYDRDKPEIDKP